MKRLTFVVVVLSVLLFSCKKDSSEDAPVTIGFNSISGDRTISIGDTLTHPTGLKYKISDLKIYISNIELTDKSGNKVPFSIAGQPGADEGVFLYRLGSNQQVKGLIPSGEYAQISFDVGLRPALNDLNPNNFSREHPLSRYTDMYWDMMKYRFVVYEGAFDTENNGSFVLPFSYHIGGDDFLRKVQLDIRLNASGSASNTLAFNLDLDHFFTDQTETIDVSTFFSYHSGEDDKNIGLKMMDFIAESIH